MLTLYDSRILQFTLTGDMALRAGWGRQPQFVLAIGGFHPRFAAPPGLPALKRLGLSLADGDTLQLTLPGLSGRHLQHRAIWRSGGSACSRRRLQFRRPARLRCPHSARPLGVSSGHRRGPGPALSRPLVDGDLLQREPGRAHPWQVQGKATIKLLFFKVSVRFVAQLVERSRRIEAVLVAHIAEVDERRVYIREVPSMFAYCTQMLHLSEHEAYARITVARASRRHPVLLEMLSDGRLH